MNEEEFAKMDLRYLFPGAKCPKVNYAEYIQSPEWKELANKAKKKAGMRCNRCGRKGELNFLQAHHRTYKRLGHEWMSDIEVLCPKCHKRETANPTPYIEEDYSWKF